MRLALTFLLAALVAVTAFAQERAEAETSSAAWKKLQAEHQKEYQEYFRPWREAKAKGEEYGLDLNKHPSRVYVAKWLAFASKHAGTDEACLALAQVVKNGKPQQKAAAVETLLKDYVESKAMKQVVWTLRYMYPIALEPLSEKSPHNDVRGLAVLMRGQYWKNKDNKEALRLFALVQEEYADIAYRGAVTLAQKAEKEIFEIEHLAVGEEAPEIEGEDIAGVAFKLSDYRGKVVMLDFWGDW